MAVNGTTGEVEDTVSPGYVERHAARQLKPTAGKNVRTIMSTNHCRTVRSIPSGLVKRLEELTAGELDFEAYQLGDTIRDDCGMRLYVMLDGDAARR